MLANICPTFAQHPLTSIVFMCRLTSFLINVGQMLGKCWRVNANGTNMHFQHFANMLGKCWRDVGAVCACLYTTETAKPLNIFSNGFFVRTLTYPYATVRNKIFKRK